MSLPMKGTLIEGISDDILFSFGAFFFGLIPFVGTIMFWNRRRDNQTIHPQSQEAVDNARQHLAPDTNPASQNGNHGDRFEEPPSRHGELPRRQGQRADGEITCPICLTDAQFAVETNCGHTFCGQCMVTYWSHGNWLGAVRCPSCRQQVNILLSIFTEEEKASNSAEKTSVVNEINRYNRRFSGEPLAWMDYIRDLPTMLRHCAREFFSVGGLIWMFRMRVFVCFIAAVLYFLSPLDIIPEAAFGFLGLIDDFFILLLLGIYISIIYRRVITERAMRAEG